MKTTAFGNSARLAGKAFFALTLLCMAVAVGFGGTALFVYHQFGDIHRSAPPARASGDHRSPAAGQGGQFRQVANVPGDQSSYTYADNQSGQPTLPAKRVRIADAVLSPLDASASTDAAQAPGILSDPESHYIVDSRTGRVVGIDGSVGAQHEAEREYSQPSTASLRAVAVQTPPPEVRVASPVLEDGLPVYHGPAVVPVNTAGSQYVPIRKALPVSATETSAGARSFNAGEYMMNNEDRPVLRAQAVVPAGAQVVRTVRIYRLPDGTQTAAAY